MEVNMETVYQARLFATAGHAAVGQVRKNTGVPYIKHPQDVVNVLNFGYATGLVLVSPVQLCAAWMHDLIEDTKITYDDIRIVFGIEVAELVRGLSKISKPEDGNRKQRHDIDNKFLQTQPREVQDIKLADIYCNCRDLVEEDPKFAIVYIEEKQEQMNHLALATVQFWNFVADQLVEWKHKIIEENALQKERVTA